MFSNEQENTRFSQLKKQSGYLTQEVGRRKRKEKEE
jgi:hypothetical protein